MDKKKITAIIATSTVAMNVTAAKTVLADTNNNNSISAVEDIKDHQAKTIMPTLNGITINKQLINRNYSKGVIIVPKYIVIHDTDNRRVDIKCVRYVLIRKLPVWIRIPAID